MSHSIWKSLVGIIIAVALAAQTSALAQAPRKVPTMAAGEAQLGGKADLSFSLASNTRSINYLGLTGLTLPCGLAGNGLPIAFQLIAPPFAEARVFNFGHQYE